MSSLLADPFSRSNKDAEITALYARKASEVQSADKPAVQALRDLQENNPAAKNFVEADNVLYKSFQGGFYFIPDRSDQGAIEDRLARLGQFTTHNGVVAAVDAEGRLIVASDTDENIKFLEDSGFRKTENVMVPLSSREVVIGVRIPAEKTPDQFITSLNVHGNVAMAMGKMPDATQYGEALDEYTESSREPGFHVGQDL